MKRRVWMFGLTLVVGIALGMIGTQVLNAQYAQQRGPTTEKGRTAKTVASLELGPQIPELQGRYLRARVVTFEPGGHGAAHSHKDRPVIAYVLQGTFSDCKPDGTCTEIQEGQAKVEGKDVVHWVANRGTKPLTFLAVEIVKEP